ncbi:hypothetical protein P2G88_18225 [Aliiglaciecola sp. CAU 1673]|uniref:hypothetical protein n=1 Tax=Aliiglaciecola sp. CAU 1673 TaxID=3032595 RepID=UPI0023DAE28F|nr:hypothetical protein [Aliiglaciecola sp. CAU 1673]MDF2180196.1 hypothetical protein [Aliiglaciecola sp. CAU 1673]
MPQQESPVKRRRQHALRRGVTSLPMDFHYLCREKPERIGIVAEGDSWFAYPRKWIAMGADVNVLHHIEERVENTDKVNLLRLACNGDEAVQMLSGRQKETLVGVLEKSAAHIQLLLFSGGGNDIVGKRDMPALLNRYQNGFSAEQCINRTRFDMTLQAVMLAYQQLLALRQDIIPHASIITHTYDIAQPVDQGAEFFWGLIKTKPWIYPYLVEKQIPPTLHLDIVRILLGTFKDKLMQLAKSPQAQGQLKVVDTQGILRASNTDDWLNEIHPTTQGFRKITKPIYQQMRTLQPTLPPW